MTLLTDFFITSKASQSFLEPICLLGQSSTEKVSSSVTATWATEEMVPPDFASYLADATLFLVELVPASSQALYLLSVPHQAMHPTPKSLIDIQDL